MQNVASVLYIPRILPHRSLVDLSAGISPAQVIAKSGIATEPTRLEFAAQFYNATMRYLPLRSVRALRVSVRSGGEMSFCALESISVVSYQTRYCDAGPDYLQGSKYLIIIHVFICLTRPRVSLLLEFQLFMSPDRHRSIN